MSRQEELEAMSDQSINETICKLFFTECKFKTVELSDVTSRRMMILDRLPFEINDYCNNPSDIMPIAIENKFRMLPDKNGYFVANNWRNDDKLSLEYCENKSLYRAICIVYLLMQEKE